MFGLITSAGPLPVLRKLRALAFEQPVAQPHPTLAERSAAPWEGRRRSSRGDFAHGPTDFGGRRIVWRGVTSVVNRRLTSTSRQL